jgi:hypothetical protein
LPDACTALAHQRTQPTSRNEWEGNEVRTEKIVFCWCRNCRQMAAHAVEYACGRIVPGVFPVNSLRDMDKIVEIRPKLNRACSLMAERRVSEI